MKTLKELAEQYARKVSNNGNYQKHLQEAFLAGSEAARTSPALGPLKQSLLIQLSLDDLQGLIIDCLIAVLGKPASVDSKTERVEKKYVYGLAGLARLLGCSHPTAQRIKDSGEIPFQQIGRKLIFDADAVLEALSRTTKKYRRIRSVINEDK